MTYTVSGGALNSTQSSSVFLNNNNMIIHVQWENFNVCLKTWVARSTQKQTENYCIKALIKKDNELGNLINRALIHVGIPQRLASICSNVLRVYNIHARVEDKSSLTWFWADFWWTLKHSASYLFISIKIVHKVHT